MAQLGNTIVNGDLAANGDLAVSGITNFNSLKATNIDMGSSGNIHTNLIASYGNEISIIGDSGADLCGGNSQIRISSSYCDILIDEYEVTDTGGDTKIRIGHPDDTALSSIEVEAWTFTLSNGTSVTKRVMVLG